MRKVAVVTGSRAEYGMLRRIIKLMEGDPQLALSLIVTGSHLSPEFGLTVGEIEKDRVPIAERVQMLLSSDSEESTAMSMGLGMIGFAKAYSNLKPDIILVLGDRFEIFAAVSAAVPFGIPVAHIHGGESTVGAIDELFRHAITKMSHLHFPAAPKYAERIAQMGEQRWRIFCLGAPGLDSLDEIKYPSKKRLLKELGIKTERRIGIVTFHPATLEPGKAGPQTRELLSALTKFTEVFWVFTKSNSDAGGRAITERVAEFVNKNVERSASFDSLGRPGYLALLKHADVMAGNSSSGLIEAPSFGLPVVNIGNRQQGRVKAPNVIDASAEGKSIETALEKALSKDFRVLAKGVKNPYAQLDASRNIVAVLKKAPLEKLGKKSFCDISTGTRPHGNRRPIATATHSI